MSEFDGVLRSLLVEKFRVAEDAIRPDASFKEMGLDSLDVVSFVMALEDRMAIEIPESDLQGVETFGDALALLERKVSASA